MEYLLICSTALAASTLTFFSGFGLGTLLLPAFSLFFPVQTAIALTAIVHLLNNLFKWALTGRKARLSVVLRFGLPALTAALVGGLCLIALSDLTPWWVYTLFGRERRIEPVKVCIAILMIFFAILELWSGAEKFSLPRKFLPVGGLLSGFFGGLSGHQGAFRSIFLLRAGLTPEEFIATGVVIACLVDFSRLFVYSAGFKSAEMVQNLPLLAAATLAAFLGAWLGNRFLGKMTIKSIRWLVSGLLVLVALLLGAGII